MTRAPHDCRDCCGKFVKERCGETDLVSPLYFYAAGVRRFGRDRRQRGIFLVFLWHKKERDHHRKIERHHRKVRAPRSRQDRSQVSASTSDLSFTGAVKLIVNDTRRVVRMAAGGLRIVDNSISAQSRAAKVRCLECSRRAPRSSPNSAEILPLATRPSDSRTWQSIARKPRRFSYARRSIGGRARGRGDGSAIE
jgi:hypothetical protein